MITDTHAHVTWESFDADREEVFARAAREGISRIVLVGTDLASSRAVAECARGRAGVYPTAGIHPHDAQHADAATRAAIEELCAAPECVAVGETGLDWFKQFSPREAQLASFRWQLALARRLDKPVIVHCRDAHEDVLELLREQRGVRGVMHCYSLGAEELPHYLELGMYISFSGVVTYPKNERNREAARAVPLERLLVETDCPFLAPQSRRGKRNEPAFLRETLGEIARLRGAQTEELARATSANAQRLFGFGAG
ncbi:MAG: TatD family hydrolase [Planctomycetes bacterium]|nr:TatD family hydrolase [Planctomycetota bacterium]